MKSRRTAERCGYPQSFTGHKKYCEDSAILKKGNNTTTDKNNLVEEVHKIHTDCGCGRRDSLSDHTKYKR